MRHQSLLYSFIQKISRVNELELTFAGKIGSLLEPMEHIHTNTHTHIFGIHVYMYMTCMCMHVWYVSFTSINYKVLYKGRTCFLSLLSPFATITNVTIS